MARIKQKDTKPERAVKRVLRRLHVGYRCNVRGMPGTPDIVLNRLRLAIFVHGCFWHQHLCPAGVFPTTNRKFWAAKFNKNLARDKKNFGLLKRSGWTVEVIWECETRNPRRLAATLKTLLDRTKIFASRRLDKC